MMHRAVKFPDQKCSGKVVYSDLRVFSFTSRLAATAVAYIDRLSKIDIPLGSLLGLPTTLTIKKLNIDSRLRLSVGYARGQ